MLDIDFIRKHPKEVEKAIESKNYNIDIDKILNLDKNVRETITLLRLKEEEQNKLSKVISQEADDRKRLNNIEYGKKIKEDIKLNKEILERDKTALNKLLLEIPNMPLSDVKVGKNENENEQIETFGNPTKFNFKPKDHVELGRILDIIDVEKSSIVSGSRFAYLKNKAVLLEFAIVQFVISLLTPKKFIPIIPPMLVKKNITEGLGYWQAGGNEDYYLVSEPHAEEGLLYLIGTAEHSIIPYHMNETLDIEKLPLRYIGFSSAFRREAGSYGKDTRGIFRVHQFDKLEMVSFTTREDSKKELELLLSLERSFFEKLKIPYRVVEMCTGDLGFPAAKKYDIEAWIPSQNKYREVTSVSTTTDFQARRLKIKYTSPVSKSRDPRVQIFETPMPPRHVHILNGTALAIGRTLIAILENHQQADGSVKIPKALQKYTGFDVIRSKN